MHIIGAPPPRQPRGLPKSISLAGFAAKLRVPVALAVVGMSNMWFVCPMRRGPHRISRPDRV